MVRVIYVSARKAFGKTRIPGADYVLNQYIGCEHACLYCYAKFVCKWYNYGRWGEWVVVRKNMPELVKMERVSGRVCMSTLSDPYQPLEKKIELTRSILRNLDKNTELSILTKSDLVLRDIDVFREFKRIEVGLTVNSFEGRVKKVLEPFSPDNEKRIRALKELKENGITTYAFVSPIIPGLVDVGEVVRETRGFVDFYWFEFLNLRAAGKEFREWLRDNYPESYFTLLNKEKNEKFVKSVVETVRKMKVCVRGICVHCTGLNPSSSSLKCYLYNNLQKS